MPTYCINYIVESVFAATTLKRLLNILLTKNYYNSIMLYLYHRLSTIVIIIYIDLHYGLIGQWYKKAIS